MHSRRCFGGQVLRTEDHIEPEGIVGGVLNIGDLHDLDMVGIFCIPVEHQEVVVALVDTGPVPVGTAVGDTAYKYVADLQLAFRQLHAGFVEVTAVDAGEHSLEVLGHRIGAGCLGHIVAAAGGLGEQQLPGIVGGLAVEGHFDIRVQVSQRHDGVQVAGAVACYTLSSQLGQHILFGGGQLVLGDVTDATLIGLYRRLYRGIALGQVLGTERVVVLVAQGLHLGSGPGDSVHSICTGGFIVCIVVYKEGIVALIHGSDVLILGGFRTTNSIGCGVATGNDVTDLQGTTGDSTGNAYPVGFTEQAAALDTDVHLLIEAHNVVGSFSAENKHAVNQVKQLVADAFLGQLVAGHSHGDIHGLVVLRQSAVEHSGGIANIAAGQLGKGILFLLGQQAFGDITRLGDHGEVIQVLGTEGVVIQEVQQADLSCGDLGLHNGLLGAVPLGINCQELAVALIQGGEGGVGLGSAAVIYIHTGDDVTDLQQIIFHGLCDAYPVILSEHAAAVDIDLHCLEVLHGIIGGFPGNQVFAVLLKQLVTGAFVGLVLHIHEDAHSLVVFRQSAIQVSGRIADIGGSQNGKTGLFSVGQLAGGDITGSGNLGLLSGRLGSCQLIGTEGVAEVPGLGIQLRNVQVLCCAARGAVFVGVVKAHPLAVALVNSAVVEVHIGAILALDHDAAAEDITDLGILDAGALDLSAVGAGNGDLAVVGALIGDLALCAGVGQRGVAVLIHDDLDACLLIDPGQNAGQLHGGAVFRPVLIGQVGNGLGLPGSQLVSIDEAQGGIGGEFGVYRLLVHYLANGGDAVGTEDVVVAPFLTDVLGEDGLGVVSGNIALRTAVFDEQELAVALVDADHISGAGAAMDGSALGAAEQVAYLEHIGGDDVAVCKCGAAVGFRHQHGAVVVVVFLFIAHPQFHLAAHILEDQVSGSVDAVGAKIDGGVHTGLAVGPGGNSCQIKQLLGAVLEVGGGELGKNTLFSGGQRSVLDVALNHFVDVLKGSGGTQDQIAFVAQILHKAAVGIKAVASVQGLREGSDLAVEPILEFLIAVEVEIAPDLGFDTGQLQALHVQQEVAVALINNCHIEAGGAAAQLDDIAGVQILHGGDGHLGGIVDGGTCVVDQHIVPLFSAVLRLFQLEVVVAEFPVDGRFVFHIGEQIFKERCEGGGIGTVGFNVHAQLAVNFNGEHTVDLDPLKVVDAHFRELLAASLAQKDQAGVGLVDLTHILLGQIGSRTYKGGQLGVDVVEGLAGTQAHEQVVHKGGGGAECGVNGIQTAFAVQRSVGGVAQVDHNGPAEDLTLFIDLAVFLGFGQIDVDEDIAGLQVFFTELVDTVFAVVLIGVAPHATVVTGNQHIVVDLVGGIGGLGIQTVHMSCDAGAVVVQVCAVGSVVLVLVEEDVHDLLDIGQLQVKTGGGLVDLLGEMGVGIYVGADLVAIVAVPGITASFKEAGHIALDLVGQLLTANDIGDGVGGDVIDPAAGADDGVAHITGHSYSVSKGAGFAGGNVGIPAQGVAVNDGTPCGFQHSALGDVLYDPQILVCNTFVFGVAAGFLVGQVVHMVAVVGDGNRVLEGFTQCGSAVGGDGNGSVDGHTRIFQTGVGDIIKAVVRGLNGMGLVVGKLILQKTGPQGVVLVDLVVAGIVVAIVDGQKIQRTANNDGVFTPAQSAHVKVLVVGIEEVVLHGGELNGAGGLSAVCAGIHRVLAAAGIQHIAVTYVQNGVTGIVEDNDVAGTHVFFPILEEVICTLGRVPVVVLNIVGGVIVVILNTLALGVPAEDGHIIRVAGVTPQGHGQTVELAAQDGVAQSCQIGVVGKAAAHGEHAGMAGSVFHKGEGCQLTQAAGVAAKRLTQVLLQRVQRGGVIFVGAALEVPGESHIRNGLFHIRTGQGGVIRIGVLVVPADGGADGNGLALDGDLLGHGEDVAGVSHGLLAFGGVDHGRNGEQQDAGQQKQAHILALFQLTGQDQPDQDAGHDHSHSDQRNRQYPGGQTALATLAAAAAAGGIGIGGILNDHRGVLVGKQDFILHQAVVVYLCHVLDELTFLDDQGVRHGDGCFDILQLLVAIVGNVQLQGHLAGLLVVLLV